MLERAFRELVSWPNLLASWQLAARGKHASEAVARFEYRTGDKLRQLQRQLWAELWQPGPYTHFHVHEPKRRLISAAPFADRIVHHALCRIIEPRFERDFIGDSFANRLGKGSHRAVDRAAQFCGQYRYVLRLDIRRHFPSIDHAILTERLFRRIPEPALRRLVSTIIASGAGVHAADDEQVLFAGDDLFALCRPRGLPIGNLTSQFWSNCYLDALDQFAKRTLGCRAYLRYVDDFCLFDDCKARLADWCGALEAYLACKLRLRVHARSAQVQACLAGVPWLGFVLFPGYRRVKARKVVQATRRLRRSHRQWQAAELPFQTFNAQVQGWINHVGHAQSWGLRKHVLDALPLC